MSGRDYTTTPTAKQLARTFVRGLRDYGLRVEVEVSGPWQAKPGIFASSLTTRIWWGYWAVAIHHVNQAESRRRGAWVTP